MITRSEWECLYDSINKSIAREFNRCLLHAIKRDRIENMIHDLQSLLEFDVIKWLEKKYPSIYEEWRLHIENKIKTPTITTK